ncbi:MAG: type II toxin-antitoxin system VapC family toxin [Solirubrobacterales bacterium]
MLVVDASVLAPALAYDDADGERAREAIEGEDLCAPHLLDLEITSVWRRDCATGRVPDWRARQAFADLADLPIVRVPHADMLPRIWELRDNVTPYDAAYVALAEALDAPLLTADARFAAAPGPRCEFRVLR